MFLHDAELETHSWRLRHSPAARATLGVWRWRGIQRNMDEILAWCAGGRVVDFGGVDGPLGLGSLVVDPKADCKTLDAVEGLVDVIFSSHALEHCEDYEGTLRAMADKLPSSGGIILHLPAWTCRRWRAEHYASDSQEPHHWTFALEGESPDVEDVSRLRYPDGDLRAWFDLSTAEHCGDDSLFIMGVKR